MEEKIKIIKDLSIEEREEVLIDIARILEGAAREAYVEGNRHFAVTSANMADAIWLNADELARDTPETAERIMQQAYAMISRFQAAYPHRVLSRSVH